MTPDQAGRALDEARRASRPADLRRRLAVSQSSRARTRTSSSTCLAAATGPARHTACQWPTWPDGEPPPREGAFCCTPVAEGRPYCPAHLVRAYVQATAVTRYPEDLPPARSKPWPPTRRPPGAVLETC